MLIPEGSIEIIKRPSVESESNSDILVIRHSPTKKYFITLNLKSFTLWFADPIISIVQHPRDESTIEIFGVNKDIVWNNKGNMICVLTEKAWVFLFHVMDGTDKDNPVFFKSITNLRDIFFEQICVFHISSYVTSMVRRRDYILLSSTDGNLEYIRWPDHSNGFIERKILNIRYVNFSYKYDSVIKGQTLTDDVYITKMASTRWTSVACILSDGKAGLLRLTINKSSMEGVMVIIKDCSFSTNLCINYLHQLIVIGDTFGNLKGYLLDKPSYEFVQAVKYSIDEARYIEHHEKAGPISLLEWSPDFSTLAVSWKNKGIALWSIYGYLISFFNYHIDGVKILPRAISMEWGDFGYYLMLVTKNSANQKPDNSAINTTTLMKTQFLKINECSKEHMILNGSHSVLISNADEVKRFFIKQKKTWKERINIFPYTLQKNWFRHTLNKQQIDHIQIITCVTLNELNNNLAISGISGLLIFHWKKQEWLTYDKENREEIFSSLMWWKQLLVMAVSTSKDTDASKIKPKFIRFQFVTESLDDKRYISHTPTEELISYDIHDDILVTLHSNSTVSFFKLTLVLENFSLTIEFISSMNFSVSITHETTFRKFKVCRMASLSTFKTKSDSEAIEKPQTSMAIFIMDGGKLYLTYGNNIDSQDNSNFPIQSTHIASYVENFWICSDLISTSSSSLNDILWVYCGSLGLKIWLPVSYFETEIKTAQSFIGKRNMISLPSSTYPLVIDRKHMIGVGVTAQLNEDSNISNYTFGSYSICFATQLILPELMLELVRKNLGMCALSIGQKFCDKETYFPHVLEVMLHQVLETEARSTAPIPDPILPSVISLINNFKCSLKIFSHCMRKTELVLWPHLFSIIGRPVDLFYKCLDKNQIDVAASYLIIVQNFESLKVCKQLALKLLNSSLTEKLWNIVEDLVRFLRTINEEKVHDAIYSKPFEQSLLNYDDDFVSLDIPNDNLKNSSLNTPTKSFKQISSQSLNNEFEDTNYLDNFLRDTALIIFREKKLRDLGYFMHSTSFSFKDLLKSNEALKIAQELNWVQLFSYLLQDFKYIAKFSLFSVEEKNLTISVAEIRDEEIQKTVESNQLKYLLSEFYSENYYEYTILLSLFLLDDSTAYACINNIKSTETDSIIRSRILNGLNSLVYSNLIGIGTSIWKLLLSLRVLVVPDEDKSTLNVDLPKLHSRSNSKELPSTPNLKISNETASSESLPILQQQVNIMENSASCHIF